MTKYTRDLPPDIHELAIRGGGVIDAATASVSGVPSGRLARLTESGLLIRLAHGCYADRHRYEAADPWEQYRLRSIAFVASCDEPTFLCGPAAASVWRLPTLGRPPDVPDVIQPKRSGLGPSSTHVGRTRVARLPRGQMLLYGAKGHRQIPIMSPAWTAADLARDLPVVEGLVIVDAALFNGEPVREMVPQFAGWDGAPRMRWVLDHAVGSAETPIESLGRFTCIEYDLPVPIANAWVGRDGPERRVDGLWPWHWAASEGDGALKYDNRPDASRVVADQNEREWELRRLGLDFARYGWSLAHRRRAELADRFRALLRDNPPRDEPMRWWKHVPGVGPIEPEPDDQPSPYPSSAVLPAGWDRHRRRR